MKAVFMGTPEFALPTLEALIASQIDVLAVFTRRDKKAGRGQKLRPSPVKVMAEGAGIPVHQPATLKKERALEPLRAFSPDVLVVVAYGMILPPAVLSLPAYGCVNLHPSLLPALRGPAPINWAIIRGLKETGISTMLMDEGVDTGPVLLQRNVPIEPEEDAGTLGFRLARIGAALMLETLERINRGELQPKPQDEARATHAPLLEKSDGRIHWTLTAGELSHRIRGFSPWPGSFCFFGQKRLRIHAAEVPEDSTALDPGGEGEIVGLDDRGILVRCGQGTRLLLKKIQREGKKAQEAATFIRGVSLKIGDVLT